MVWFFSNRYWGLEDEGEMVYKVSPMAFKGETRLIFMQIEFMVILDEPELGEKKKKRKKKRELPA